MSTDLVLSSGWLAFASHTGFLAAIEDLDLDVDGICGTSSGALTGSLFAAGMPSREIFALLTGHPPLSWVRPSVRPWEGLLDTGPMVAELERHLPATFAELPRPFGVGVIHEGAFALLTEGPLATSVAASCAVPWLFRPVRIGGVPYQDGGVADRTGLEAWRVHRGSVDPICHVLAPSFGPDGPVEATRVVRSPGSGAQLWSLGDVQSRFDRTFRATRQLLDRTPT
ncbi:MAG: patatin-like phospholipase family protein [Myxococcota bacterium]